MELQLELSGTAVQGPRLTELAAQGREGDQLTWQFGEPLA